MAETLFTSHQLAEELHLAVPLLTKLTQCGLIPFATQNRGQYYYSLPAVQEALSQSVRELKSDYSCAHPFTYQDYRTLPETMQKTEILDGVLIQEPSPLIKHQKILTRLHIWLHEYFATEDPEGIVLVCPVDVTLSDTVLVQPDLLYVSGQRKKIITETRVNGSPDLAVEIISPSSVRKDRVVKFEIYQRFAVPHYWLVDAAAEAVETYALNTDGIYSCSGKAAKGRLSVPAFPGLIVNLDALWT